LHCGSSKCYGKGCVYTDKKAKKIFLVYKEIQLGVVAKYIRGRVSS
jgi:hypothetical protein